MKKIFFLSSFLLLGCVSNNQIYYNKHIKKNPKIIKKAKKKEKIYFNNKICALGFSQNKNKKIARKIALLRAKAEISRILHINISNEIDSKISSNGKHYFQTKSTQDSLSYLKNLKIENESYKNNIYTIKICKEGKK